MAGNYEQWLKQENAWIEESEKKLKESLVKYSVMIIAGCTVGFGAIGIVSGAGISGMLSNMLIGLIFGAVGTVIFVLCMMASLPAKKYSKEIEREVTQKLSSSEKEEMASQMLGIDKADSYRMVTGICEDKTERKVAVSRDYMISSNSRGFISLVCLKNVERVECDIHNGQIVSRGGGVKVTEHYTNYTIDFIYKSSGEANTKRDEWSFESREMRDKVLAYMKELQEN